MATFIQLKNFVYTSIGRDATDAAAVLVVPMAINYAVEAIANVLKPPELNYVSTVIITSGNNSYSLANVDFIDIISVYNSTDSIELNYIPYENWNILVPVVAATKYYTIFGDNLYVNRLVPDDVTLLISHLKYPTAMVGDASTPSFDHHDAYIISIAAVICFAVFEEGESVDLWSKVGEGLGLSVLKAAQMREVVSGKAALLESTITGTISGSK
jgi:hypothetical protein